MRNDHKKGKEKKKNLQLQNKYVFYCIKLPAKILFYFLNMDYAHINFSHIF